MQRLWLVNCCIVCLCWGFVPNASAQNCPAAPIPSISFPQPPADVCIPDGFGSLPIDFFDDYSWRAFIALVWPAAAGQRGVPDTAQTVGADGPRVFDTYKALWEIFHADGTKPTSSTFNDYEQPVFNACNKPVSFGDLVLASFSKFSDLGQAGSGTLVGPLPDQHGLYVRYLTLYNSTEFDFINSRTLYFRSSIPAAIAPTNPPPLPFPNGSIDVKAAWIDMTPYIAAQRARFYTRTATVLDPQSGACNTITVGLVGLHIVQKTPSRPQWIWSTFEQVDNVPPADPGAPGGFTFNNGNPSVPMPPSNPNSLSPLTLPPNAVNVVRSFPIHPNTVATNKTYRRLLAGTVWANYQLVMTQWPKGSGSQPVPPTESGAIANTFPGGGANSAFANTTLETFEQGNPRTGCMACHDGARMQGDFVWSMLDHAFPPVGGTPDRLIRDQEFRSLSNLLKQSQIDLRPTALRRNQKAAKSRQTEQAPPAPH